MEEEVGKNKRIAKNTLLLYVRMLLLMLVSLYTSRVILKALGVDDYGINNVVGGIVAMFTTISGSLSSAISRFITYELGKGDKERLKRIFSSALIIQFVLSLLVVLLAETIGLWFLNTQMVIPPERIEAANWVYQFAIFAFVTNLMNVPYNASIISHEKMSAFAFISIFEAVFKLFVAWSIVFVPFDRLIYFSCFTSIVSVVIIQIYRLYSKRHFEECTFNFVHDLGILKQMFGFAGWNFIGASSVVFRDQGVNILINLFFGPAVNAARAIAMQVNNAVSSFVTNFMVALNPQITKSYAIGEYEYMFKLIFQGARLSYYILFLLGLPIIFNTNYVLNLWLDVVPECTIVFVQYTLIFTLCESISYPLITVMLATGKIKYYQIFVGGLQMLNLPVSFVCLYFGASPESVIVVAIIISQFCLVTRLYMLRKMISLNIKEYLIKVYFNVIMVSLFSLIVPYFLSFWGNDTFFSFLLHSIVSILFTIVVELYIGCDKQERQFALGYVYRTIGKVINR